MEFRVWINFGVAVVASLSGGMAFVMPNVVGGPVDVVQKAVDMNQGELPAPTFTKPIVAAEAAAVPESWFLQSFRWLSIGVVVGLLGAALSTTPVEAYNTPILGKANWEHDIVKGSFAIGSNRSRLEPCSKNKRFSKRIKDELYKFQQRQNKYPEGSVVYNRFVEKAAMIKRRQNAYGDRLCGKKDGLPRVMSDNTVKGGVTTPTLLFIYIAGQIGWAGRSYLLRTRDPKKEIYIDVPLALMCMASSFAWPVLGWQEIVNGDMVLKDEDIYRTTPFIKYPV